MNPRQAIVTKSLTRRFGETVAVDRLTLNIECGEVFGFLGHNGAGKTTTVRLLNGILTPHGGTVRVLGLDPMSDGPTLRGRTGVLTETPALSERLTGRENLRLAAELYGVPPTQVQRRVTELLTRFELAKRGNDLVGGYSKGMKQRLALARALIHRPELLFLDEPTSGLDPVATRQVHELIHTLSRDGDHTVFLCTHNLAEAQQLCNRVAVMEHGQLVALGTPTKLARDLRPGVRLEIEVAPEQASSAQTTLETLSAVQHVERGVETGRLRVTLREREAVPTLVEALVRVGVRLYRLNPQEPTLEDVYFALHETNRVEVEP
ncbi:MAG: ATP-binding cassette domain-containing protein [Anaerolineae bacterium]